MEELKDFDDTVSLHQENILAMTRAILEEGYVPQDFCGITDEQLEATYYYGYNLFNDGHFKQAESVFHRLCYLNHYQGRFWLGLGGSLQKQKKYAKAIEAYSVAALIDVENPLPALHAAECYNGLKMTQKTREAARAAMHWAGEKPEFDKYKKRAEKFLQQGKTKPQIRNSAVVHE